MFYFQKLFLNWRITVLQCCAGFWSIALRIPVPVWTPPPSRVDPTLQVVTETGWAPCVIYQLPTSCLSRCSDYSSSPENSRGWTAPTTLGKPGILTWSTPNNTIQSRNPSTTWRRASLCVDSGSSTSLMPWGITMLPTENLTLRQWRVYTEKIHVRADPRGLNPCCSRADSLNKSFLLTNPMLNFTMCLTKTLVQITQNSLHLHPSIILRS